MHPDRKVRHMHHAGTADSVPRIEYKIAHNVSQDSRCCGRTTLCVVRATTAMFLSRNSGSDSTNPRVCARLSLHPGGRGLAFGSRKHFPRKAVGISSAAFLLGHHRTRRVRNAGNSVHGRRTTGKPIDAPRQPSPEERTRRGQDRESVGRKLLRHAPSGSISLHGAAPACEECPS